jgi:hypothetical protein
MAERRHGGFGQKPLVEKCQLTAKGVAKAAIEISFHDRRNRRSGPTDRSQALRDQVLHLWTLELRRIRRKIATATEIPICAQQLMSAPGLAAVQNGGYLRLDVPFSRAAAGQAARLTQLPAAS